MPPSRPIRLAILEADTPQPKTLARVGTYAAVFTALFQGACDTATPPKKLDDELIITGHAIVDDLDAYPEYEDIDAILISGSRHNAFDDDEWIIRLIQYTWKALATNRIRVIGVCFGHQIICRAAGCLIGRSPKGWEVAVKDVELTPTGQEIFGLEKMRIHQMHSDISSYYPEDSIVLGHNEFCFVQAMYRRGRYIGVQGHPEFTEEIVTEILVNRHAAGVLSDEVYLDGMARAGNEHDGFAIARGCGMAADTF